MGSFASPAFPHRRSASAALAQIRAAAIPVATATALLSLYGAGLRVVALLGLPLLAAAFGARPLPRGPRAALSTLTGVLGLGGGLIARNPLLVAAAIVFLAAGLGSAWGVNRGRRRRRAWAYRSLTALASILVALILVYPWLIAIDYLAKPREAIDAQALGLPHRDVGFVASDGVRLAGWYAPGRNGAAIVLVHGGGGDREGTIRHAPAQKRPSPKRRPTRASPRSSPTGCKVAPPATQATSPSATGSRSSRRSLSSQPRSGSCAASISRRR
jgi:hypothetical protein